jgi:hypothetical protein
MDLPLVKEEICWPVEKELLETDFLTKYSKHIIEVNPVVGTAIGIFIDKLPHYCKGAAIIAASVTYRLLESQAEADRMERDLNI